MSKLDQAKKILRDAIETTQPCAILGLMSGGHDSYTVTHFAASVLGTQLSAVCHIDTGIGIPDTQQFVIDRCKAHDWPLKIYRATENVSAKGEADPQDYDAIVRQHGFPGPASHRQMYARLKERQVRRMRREHQEGRRPVMFISGARQEESTRRMGTAQPVTVDGSSVWVAPFAHMTGSDLQQYMVDHELPRNPVKDRLCMSGECLCGAFAKPGELREIAYWYPEVAQRIRSLEADVARAGFPWGWEDERPPKWWSDRRQSEAAGQMDAFDAEFESAVERLCSSCAARNEREAA